jgi:hypothetical protein
VGPVFFTVTREQQKSAGQPLLAGVEQLIDQVLLDANVPLQHEIDESVRQGVLLVKHPEHFSLLNDQHGAGCNRSGRAHAKGLACQTAFAKEVAGSQNGDDSLFAGFTNHGELHAAFLQVHYTLGGITLRVDDLRSLKSFYFSQHPRRFEKSLGVECGLFGRWTAGFFLVGNRSSFHKTTP